MKIALLQLNTTAGKPADNAARIAAAVRAAENMNAAFCIAPNLALSGLAGEDLAHLPGFARTCRDTWEQLARDLASRPPLLLGTLIPGAPPQPGAVLLYKGDATVLPLSCKASFSLENIRFSLSRGIPEALPADAPDALICLANPQYYPRWQHAHANRLAFLAKGLHATVLSLHPVGFGQGRIFSGESMAITRDGRLIAKGRPFAEDTLILDLPGTRSTSLPLPEAEPDEHALCNELWNALTLGVRDHVRKSGLSGVALGLSGGLDSAVTAAVAVEALGPENVLGLIMPSPHSSDHSVADAEQLAANLGMAARIIPIGPGMHTFNAMLAPLFEHRASDVTEENIQARVRGTLLMSVANKFQKMILATGNKSEIAAGYCTLYGDTVGGLAPLGDIFKTDLYKLAAWYNLTHPDKAIPRNTISKEPSAELRPGQKDSDSLPPYPTLDAILEAVLERGLDRTALLAEGHEPALVDRTLKLLVASEFKRRQLPPQLIVSTAPFGSGGWKIPF